MIKKILLSSAAILTTCCFTCSAFAQDVGVTTLPEVRIEADNVQAVLGNEEISEEDLVNRNPGSLKDIFAGESSISASGGAAIATKVFVNGIEESLLSVTIDGARQNKSAFHHTGNILIDPELLKKVEVSEGIAPADAGPSALAGLIAYETKDVADLLEPGDNFGGLVTLSTDTNGTDLRASATVFGRENGLEYLLSYTRHIGDDYDDGSNATVVGTEPDVTAYTVKLAGQWERGDRLEISASKTADTGNRAAQAGPGGILFTRPDFFGVVGRATTLIEGIARRESITVTYTDEEPQGQWDPTLQVSYNKQYVDAGGAKGKNESYSAFAKNKWTINGGTLTGGVDVLHEKASGDSYGAFGSDGSEQLLIGGIFAQARQDLTDRLSVSYGGRADAATHEGADGSDRSDAGLSANASLDYKLTQEFAFTGGAATSWGGYELGEAALINFFTPWNYSGVQTSRANNLRAGLRYENNGFAISSALFYTEINSINNVLSSTRGQTDDLTSKGIDSSLSYTHEYGFFRANYTYADVDFNGDTVSSTGYYYGRPTGHVFGLEAAYQATDEIKIGANGQIALKFSDSTVTHKGYEVFNVFASYEPMQVEGLELRFDVKNIFDETYELRHSDGIGQSTVVPLNEPGRTFQLTTRIKF